MQFFKKTIYITVLSAIICAGSFMFAGSINAQDTGNISVVFAPNPLFQEENFLPGSIASGSAQVTNTSGEEKPIVVEAINITNDEVGEGELFGDALDLAIKENSTELFSGTLTQFFNKGEIYLSNLGNGASTAYDFTITFNGAAENKYQEKNLGFDILIGFQGEGGSGNGGGENARGLSIFDETSKYITDITATIEWETSYFSTSRAVYCRQDQNCVFDFYDNDDAPPLYGYQSTTAEYDTPASSNGVKNHKVLISGLTPNTTYNYRVISHASPPTISREHFFTTSPSSQVAISRDAMAEEYFDSQKLSMIRHDDIGEVKIGIERNGDKSSQEEKTSALDVENTPNEANREKPETSSELATKELQKNEQKAVILKNEGKSDIKDGRLWVLLFIIIIIIIGFYILINKRKKTKGKSGYNKIIS